MRFQFKYDLDLKEITSEELAGVITFLTDNGISYDVDDRYRLWRNDPDWIDTLSDDTPLPTTIGERKVWNDKRSEYAKANMQRKVHNIDITTYDLTEETFKLLVEQFRQPIVKFGRDD